MRRISGLDRNMTAARAGIALFAAALLYPLTGLIAPIGRWQWGPDLATSGSASIAVSLGLTLFAMVIIVLIGTPVGYYLARASHRERAIWQAALLISILLPPLALGILLTLAFGPATPLGAWLLQAGIRTTNTVAAFVVTQIYVSIGYYVLGATAAFAAVPRELERHAALLGVDAPGVFRRVTFPLARLGLAAALALAWVRAVGEFGAVAITAYYPAGMPVQLWTNLQSAGLPAVMPLLVAFLAAALPLPWVVQLLAQRRRDA